MKFGVIAVCVSLATFSLMAAELPKPLVTGMVNPESVCLGKDGAIYITEIGEFGKEGDGQITVVREGKPSIFAKGLDDPKGIVFYQNALYATDKTRVVKIDEHGSVTVLAAAENFPTPPMFLNDIEIAPATGTLYVSDSGTLQGEGGAVYSIDVKTGKVNLLLNAKTLEGLNTPNGLSMDGPDHLLLVDFGSGVLYRIAIKDQSTEKLADGFDGGDGLTWDQQGRLFITSWKTGKVFVIPKRGEKPVLVTDKFTQAADSCLDTSGKHILVPDMKAGTLTAMPSEVPE